MIVYMDDYTAWFYYSCECKAEWMHRSVWHKGHATSKCPECGTEAISRLRGSDRVYLHDTDAPADRGSTEFAEWMNGGVLPSDDAPDSEGERHSDMTYRFREFDMKPDDYRRRVLDEAIKSSAAGGGFLRIGVHDYAAEAIGFPMESARAGVLCIEMRPDWPMNPEITEDSISLDLSFGGKVDRYTIPLSGISAVLEVSNG